MKKSVILLASAILVVSCDIPAGGNKGRIRKTDEVVRYDDPNAPKGTYKPVADTAQTVNHVVADSTKSAIAPEVRPAAAEEQKTVHH